MPDLRTMVNDVLDAKVEMYELREKLGYMEKELTQELVNKAPEMLSINWNRLCRAMQVEPLRHRLDNRHR